MTYPSLKDIINQGDTKEKFQQKFETAIKELKDIVDTIPDTVIQSKYKGTGAVIYGKLSEHKAENFYIVSLNPGHGSAFSDEGVQKKSKRQPTEECKELEINQKLWDALFPDTELGQYFSDKTLSWPDGYKKAWQVSGYCTKLEKLNEILNLSDDLKLGNIPATNLVFQRSSSNSVFTKQQFKDAINACWPIHDWLIKSIIKPKIIVYLAYETYENVTIKLRGNQSFKETIFYDYAQSEKARTITTCHIDNRLIIGLYHVSRNWLNSNLNTINGNPSFKDDFHKMIADALSQN